MCPKVTNTFPILPPLSTRFGPPFIAIVTVFRSVYMKRKPRMPSFQLLRMVALITPNAHTPSPLHFLIKSQLRTRTNPRRSNLASPPSLPTTPNRPLPFPLTLLKLLGSFVCYFLLSSTPCSTVYTITAGVRLREWQRKTLKMLVCVVYG